MNMEKLNFDLGENPELEPESESTVESDEETLEQKEEVIPLPLSQEDFELFESVGQKFKEKTDEDPEKFKKARDFAVELRKKHGPDALKYALMHLIIVSTIDGLNEPTIEKVDFEGEDSIAKFIDNL